MKIIFNILSMIIVITVVCIASLNINGLSVLILWAFAAGILLGTFWAAAFYSQIQTKLKEYQRKLEKTSVQTDEESSKIAVLEQKIQVLEKSLQSALEKIE